MQKFLNTWQKLTSGSTNRKIFGAAVIVSLSTALVKVAAVVKELVIAWRFGTGDALDAFLIAWMLPMFIINVAARSFKSAFIPTYILVLEQEGTKVAQKLFLGVKVWSLGLLGITTILMVGAAPLYLPWIAVGFSPEKLNLTFHLLCAIAPVVLLSGILTIWSAVLNAGERFTLAALSPIITPAISIVFLLMAESWGIFVLAAGLVCGAVLEIVILGAALHRQGVSLRPRWHGFDTHLRQVATQYPPMLAGSFLMFSSDLVDQSMATMLLPGSVAALNYGNKLIALPINLIIVGLGTAVSPYFSKMASNQNWEGVRHTLKSYMWLTMIITIPLTGLLFMFSKPIVQIVYQRGAVTVEDVQVIADVLAFYTLKTPFHIGAVLLLRLFESLRKNNIIMQVAAINLILNTSFNYLFMRLMGVAGIALSTSCTFLVSFLFLQIRMLQVQNNLERN